MGNELEAPTQEAPAANATPPIDISSLKELFETGLNSLNERFDALESTRSAPEPGLAKNNPGAEADPIKTAYPELASYIEKHTKAVRDEFTSSIQETKEQQKMESAIEYLQARPDLTDEMFKKISRIINSGEYKGLSNHKKALELAYKDAGGKHWTGDKVSNSRDSLEANLNSGKTRDPKRLTAKSLSAMNPDELKKLHESGEIEKAMKSGTFWEE